MHFDKFFDNVRSATAAAFQMNGVVTMLLNEQAAART